MPVQVARRRANSRRGSRLGRREKQRRTVNFNGELGRGGHATQGEQIHYGMRDYQRPQLAKPPINEREYYSERQNADGSDRTLIGMVKKPYQCAYGDCEAGSVLRRGMN